MPKIVDWDERRDQLLAATCKVIVRDGLAKTTIRSIAAEAGCSRGILAHYFNDKEDLLASALKLSHSRVLERIKVKTKDLTGMAALRVSMLEALPLDADRDLEAQIEVSFWGRVLGDTNLRALHHEELDVWWSYLRDFLHQAEVSGELRADLDIEVATHALICLIDGLSVERVLYEERVTLSRQVELLDRLLASMMSVQVAVSTGEPAEDLTQ